MKVFLAVLALFCLASGMSAISIVSKSEWGGRSPTSKSSLAKGLSYVVIHHSAGAYCSTKSTCSAQMRNMQSYHMDSLGWADIGYNYGIGADGNIYEGRGAGVMGAHATSWNSKSYGIMFIGNYNDYTPTATQIAKAKELIAYLVAQGYVSSSYTIYGHRQVGSTECPGTNLYNEIKTWPNWKAIKIIMKSQHLQAMFARKREMEHMHKERTQAVSKYYDHWGKVTERFENWSTPEYYKQADDKLQHNKDIKEKEKNLDERREKLRRFLSDENEEYDLEIKDKQRSRKSRTHSTTTLQKLNENLKEQQTMKRKLELEAKLYGKWRHGVDDDNLIFESKSDNEVIAKLNWLDKQVEQQLEREKDEVQAKERDLRLQEEMNKAEQLHKERHQIREKEIREIRALQEMHMDQLKERQSESSSLKEQEQKYRESLENLEKELDLLDESYAGLHQPSDFGGAYNLTKIKVYMRKRSEVFRNKIKLCVSILERCLECAEKSDLLKSSKEKLTAQLDSEMYQLTQIDAMYESEAKYNLQKCEELWKLQSRECYKELKDLLNCEHLAKMKLLNDVVRKQNDLIDIRTTHLNAIESTSEKLKQLIKEEEDSPRSCIYSSPAAKDRDGDECNKSVKFSPRNGQRSPRGELSSPNSARSIPELSLSNINLTSCSHRGRGLYNTNYEASSEVDHVTNTFNHLSMDGSENHCVSKRDSDVVRMGGTHSLQVVTADNVQRPKFGRKRVAWN